jgi:hypothetical protein
MELNIYQVRADIAVVGILRRQRCAGQGLASLAQLREEWPRYGLRQSDLYRSVVRLESLGLVSVERLKGLQWLALTRRGDRWAMSMRTWLHRLQMLPARIARWVRHFGGAVGQGDPRRRLQDRLGRAVDA